MSRRFPWSLVLFAVGCRIVGPAPGPEGLPTLSMTPSGHAAIERALLRYRSGDPSGAAIELHRVVVGETGGTDEERQRAELALALVLAERGHLTAALATYDTLARRGDAASCLEIATAVAAISAALGVDAGQPVELHRWLECRPGEVPAALADRLARLAIDRALESPEAFRAQSARLDRERRLLAADSALAGSDLGRTIADELSIARSRVDEELAAAGQPGDRDRDGVLDADDECVDVPGPTERRGCPGDADGDGVIDGDDACPAVVGVVAERGCPAPVATAAPPPAASTPAPPPASPAPASSAPAPPPASPAPASSAPASPPPTSPPTPAAKPRRAAPPSWVVAVMDISGTTDRVLTPRLLRGLTDQIRVFLGVRRLKVVGRGEMDAAMRELVVEEKKRSYATCVDASCQIPLGKVLAASHILRLGIEKFGSTCTLNGELIDLATEVTAAAASGRSACSADGLLDAAEKLADELIENSVPG